MEAVLAAPDRSTWSGERDFVLFSTAYNTGTRVSELAALNVEDVELVRTGGSAFSARVANCGKYPSGRPPRS